MSSGEDYLLCIRLREQPILNAQQAVGTLGRKIEGDESALVSLRGQRDETVIIAPAHH